MGAKSQMCAFSVLLLCFYILGKETLVLTMLVPGTGINVTDICHYRIHLRNDQLYIHPNRVFSDIFALVDHYKRKYVLKSKDTY